MAFRQNPRDSAKNREGEQQMGGERDGLRLAIMIQRISKREQLLLMLVGGALFVLANLWFFSWIKRERLLAVRAIQEIESEQVLDAYLLETKEYWLGAQAWLQGRTVEPPNLNNAWVELLDSTKKAAQTAGLDLNAPAQPPQDKSAKQESANVRLAFDVNGNWEAVVRFLAVIQDPEQFVGVTNLNMKKSKEEISAKVIVSRYFPSPENLQP